MNAARKINFLRPISRWRRSLVFGAAVALSAHLALAQVREIALSAVMPEIGDHTALSWREGPPYVTNFRPEDASNARYSSERRFLRLATGRFAADFDTEKITLTGFAARRAPANEEAVAQESLAALPLPPADLRLAIRSGDTSYRCVGRSPLALDPRGMPKLALEFPVRLIESGRFFQKFTLHDLDFRAADGRRLPITASLEVSAWPDRLLLVLVVRAEETLPSTELNLGLHTVTGTAEQHRVTAGGWEKGTELRVILSVGPDGLARPPEASNDVAVEVSAAEQGARTTVLWNAEEAGHTIRLTAPSWPRPTEGNYSESMLDAWESYTVTLQNPSTVARRVALNFDYTPTRSIIGYVPMILDVSGAPSGIPVQISKDWHVARSGEAVPYMGSWMHGRTWLNLPANARVTFHYGTTYARWGGVPTASLAQLSLVGWGHNGFWDQLALGGFGETVCFQPGRVMRRCLLTDFRPLYQRGMSKDERWAWTGNVGGADTMVRLDPQGRYVPFKRNVTRYASHGPNLAHVIYDEVSDDDAIRSTTEVFLPRTDDCVRVYLRVRYDVTRRVEFSRLAFFQLGADFYNDVDAPMLAWGDAAGLVTESRLAAASGARLQPAWQARGQQPWLSLHGEERADLSRGGQSSRGLIVREWRATLGGRAVPAPYFVPVGSRGGKSHLAAEIAPPSDVTALEPGDSVEMLLEILALPLTAERYYGPDNNFAAALATGANTWKMVHREARANRPQLKLNSAAAVRAWPLSVSAATGHDVSFTLAGGLGYVPVRITHLAAADAVTLYRVTPAGNERVEQGNPSRAFWQSNYDAANASWTTTFNLPATETPTNYVAALRERAAVPSKANQQPALLTR